MSDKGVIFFDIDKTLLNTNQLSKEIAEKLEDLRVREYGNLPQFAIAKSFFDIHSKFTDNLKLDYKQVSFELAGFLGLKEKKLWGQIKNILEVCEYSGYTFANAENILVDLRNKRFDIGVFSEGDSWFQNLKLEKMGLQRYFKEELCLISQNKLVNIHQIPNGAIVVDDNERIVFGIKDKRPDVRIIKVDPKIGISELDVDIFL